MHEGEIVTKDQPQFWQSQVEMLLSGGEATYPLVALAREGFVEKVGDGWNRQTMVIAQTSYEQADGSVICTIRIGKSDPNLVQSEVIDNYFRINFAYTDTVLNKPINVSLSAERTKGKSKIDVFFTEKNAVSQFLLVELQRSGYFKNSDEAEVFRWRITYELLQSLIQNGKVDAVATKAEFDRKSKLGDKVEWAKTIDQKEISAASNPT